MIYLVNQFDLDTISARLSTLAQREIDRPELGPANAGDVLRQDECVFVGPPASHIFDGFFAQLSRPDVEPRRA